MQEGYPVEVVKVSYEKTRRVVARNQACFPVTVFVNQKDYSLPAHTDVELGTDNWTSWNWMPGTIGSMNEKTVQSPVKEKSVADFGPRSGVTHQGDHEYSYDFSVPEGTSVYAMDSGIVIRVVQNYSVAHQDKGRIDQVNKVEVLHPDGTFSAYAHLKANTVGLKVCDSVSTGQIIGLSGHNGFSSGPHLHVDLMRAISGGKFHTIPLKFLSK